MTDLRTLTETGSAPTSSRDGKPSLQVIERTPRLILHLATALAGKFERDLEESLSGELRIAVRVAARPIEAIRFASLFKSLAPLRIFWPLGNACTAAIHFSPALAFGILARLLGGTDSAGPAPARSLTPLEENLLHSPLHRLADRLAGDLGMEPTLFALGSATTESADMFASFDPLLALSFDVRFESRIGNLTLALPTEFLQTRLNRSVCKAIAGDTPLPVLKDASVQFCALAASTSLTPQEVDDLQVGDIITTGIPAGEKLKLQMECGPRMVGDAVQFRGRCAVARIDVSDLKENR